MYRGAAIPELAGRYLYSDYCGGWLRSLRYDGAGATEARDWPVADIGNVVSFGQDGQNVLYMISGGGAIYRIARQ